MMFYLFKADQTPGLQSAMTLFAQKRHFIRICITTAVLSVLIAPLYAKGISGHSEAREMSPEELRIKLQKGLHAAAYSGNIEIIKKTLSLGAPINSIDFTPKIDYGDNNTLQYNSTPLLKALLGGRKKRLYL